MAEIAGVDDDPDTRIPPREGPEFVHRTVRRGIVDEQILEVIPGQVGHHLAGAAVKFVDIALLVKAGGIRLMSCRWAMGLIRRWDRSGSGER